MSESTKPIRLAKGNTAPSFELESDEYKHYALADFEHLNFVLLSDPEYEVHKLYGTVEESEKDGKHEYTPIGSTFIINGDGSIEDAEYDVD